MTDANDITAWIDGVRKGDSLAAQNLWAAYFEKLTSVARTQLEGARKTAVDEEDIALSALKSFCMAAKDGRFEQLVDRESLWPLLVSITAHKSIDAIRHENRRKRGGTGGAEGNEDAPGRRVDLGAGPEGISGFDFLDAGPSPEFAAELTDQFHSLLNALDQTGDQQLRRIAISKMEGATTGEIATELDCARRTVERKMNIIRRTLTDQLDSSDSSMKTPSENGGGPR